VLLAPLLQAEGIKFEEAVAGEILLVLLSLRPGGSFSASGIDLLEDVAARDPTCPSV
jgi:hypothetical protein